MGVLEQHTKVSAFIERWKDHGDEKQETQRFWIDLLQNGLDIKEAELGKHAQIEIHPTH